MGSALVQENGQGAYAQEAHYRDAEKSQCCSLLTPREGNWCTGPVQGPSTAG